MSGTSDLMSHWNTAYENKAVDQLGWYEESPDVSLDLIDSLDLSKEAKILIAGAGASTLVDELLNLGYKKIIANDLSVVALKRSKDRLGPGAEDIRWVVDDLTNSKELVKLKSVDLWHDRAVLHFFTDPADQARYFELLKQLVKPGGHAIIGAFNKYGAKKCSGLDLVQYDEEMLKNLMMPQFDLIKHFNHTHITPGGSERPYVYTLFQRRL